MIDIDGRLLYYEKARNLTKKIIMQLKPIVFIAVGDHSVVVATPNSSHTIDSWKEIEETIRATYIREYIDQPTGRRRGVSDVLEFFGRHPEWNCTFSEGTAIFNHLLVE